MKQCAKSKTEPGDGLDNDCDGNIDEEILNEKDDDGDGKLDEDLQLVRRAKYSVLVVYDCRLAKGSNSAWSTLSRMDYNIIKSL